jgi:transcriptional regulator with XRE-family HTH domain
MTPKQARIELGLSQRQLAVKAKISRNTILKAERLKRWPVNDLIFRKYALALGLKITR